MKNVPFPDGDDEWQPLGPSPKKEKHLLYDEIECTAAKQVVSDGAVSDQCRDPSIGSGLCFLILSISALFMSTQIKSHNGTTVPLVARSVWPRFAQVVSSQRGVLCAL